MDNPNNDKKSLNYTKFLKTIIIIVLICITVRILVFYKNVNNLELVSYTTLIILVFAFLILPTIISKIRSSEENFESNVRIQDLEGKDNTKCIDDYYSTYHKVQEDIAKKRSNLKNVKNEDLNNKNYSVLGYKMGEYDNIKITPNNHWKRRMLTPSAKHVYKDNVDCGFMKSPCNLPLMGKNEFVSPDGKVGLLKDDVMTPDLPSVNGNKSGPKKMFMFAYNQCKPECCPSTYSCNGGCICTTKNQRKYLAGRGSLIN